MVKNLTFFTLFTLLSSVLVAGKEAEYFFNTIPEEGFQQTVMMRLHETCVYPAAGEDFIVPQGLKVTAENNLVFDETVLPSKALMSFLMPQETKEHWKIDCTIAMLVSHSLYALKLIVEEDFNEYITDFALNKELQWSPHIRLISPVNIPILKADRENLIGYIRNLKKYETIFLGSPGIYRGINVITCGVNEIGEMTYLGFEPIFKTGPKTKLEIYDVLASHLCDDPIPNDLFSKIRMEKQSYYQKIWKNDKNLFFRLLDEAQDKGKELIYSYELRRPSETMED